MKQTASFIRLLRHEVFGIDHHPPFIWVLSWKSVIRGTEPNMYTKFLFSLKVLLNPVSIDNIGRYLGFTADTCGNL